MQLRKMILAASAFALTSLAHASPNPNLIVNGSFEDLSKADGLQQLASGSWSVFASLPGWTTVWGDGIEVRNNVAGTAQDGKQFVELDSHDFGFYTGKKTSNSAMAQDIVTAAGQDYSLSFWYSARPGTENFPAGTNNIKVFWNGQLLDLLHANAKKNSVDNAWVEYTYTVKGTGHDVLKFAASGKADTYGGSLDNVSLIAMVPEPETYALMLAGLGLVGAISRRKKKTAA